MRPLSFAPTFVVCLCLTLLCGCGSEAPSTLATEDGHHDEHDPDEHADEDEQHHHDHEIPDHKPADFASAVEDQQDRWDEIATELDHGHFDHLGHEMEEFLDIAGWLPEIAADSDMRKAPWDRVNAESKRLLAELEPLKSSLAGDAPPADWSARAERVRATLAALDELVGSEATDSPDVAAAE